MLLPRAESTSSESIPTIKKALYSQQLFNLEFGQEFRKMNFHFVACTPWILERSSLLTGKAFHPKKGIGALM